MALQLKVKGRCITYAFKDLKLKAVNAIALKVNVPPINIMKKIRIKEVKVFNHPLFESHEIHKECVLYEILDNQ